MKIAYILPSLAQKGPILVAKDIVSYLHDKVDGIDVYYFDDIVEVAFECPVYKIDFSDKIDFDKYDIIHSHMYRPDKYIWKNRKIIKSKTVSTIHCDFRKDLRYSYNFFISWIYRWVWLFFLRRHDKIVGLSHSIIKEYYGKYIPASKLCCIYNGKRISTAHPPEDNDKHLVADLKGNGLKIIGTCAGLTKRKGLHYIIKALPYLPDYAFIIIGDGKAKKNLMSLAAKLNVLDRCFFLGFKKNVEQYLPLFDIYAMPSLSEGFPLALIEATLMKRSCVCSDISVFREVFSEKEVTFFSLNDMKSLQKAIKEAYDKRKEKGENAYNYAITHYTAEVMGEEYLEIYQKLIGSQSLPTLDFQN
jgi:glycosyltransferase involved in cell wall biosynthesis